MVSPAAAYGYAPLQMQLSKGLRAKPPKHEAYTQELPQTSKEISSQASKPDAAVSLAAAYGVTVAQALQQDDIASKKQEQGCIMSW